MDTATALTILNVMKTRTADDLVVRDPAADGILVGLESMRVAALISVLGVCGKQDKLTGKGVARLMGMLKETHAVWNWDVFPGSWIDRHSPPSRVTLLDLVVLFGQSDMARCLADMGVDMNLWDYTSGAVLMTYMQRRAVVEVLASGRFWLGMLNLLRSQSWPQEGRATKERMALTAIRMGERDVSERLSCIEGVYARWSPSWSKLCTDGQMSVIWLFEHIRALEVAVSIGLDVVPYCTMRMQNSGWTYYGMFLWEVALLTGHAEAAWILIKSRHVQMQEIGSVDAGSRLELTDWQWIQSRDALSGEGHTEQAAFYVKDIDGCHQSWCSYVAQSSFWNDLARVISMSKSSVQQKYGMALMQVVRQTTMEQVMATKIMDYLHECPAILLRLGQVL